MKTLIIILLAIMLTSGCSNSTSTANKDIKDDERLKEFGSKVLSQTTTTVPITTTTTEKKKVKLSEYTEDDIKKLVKENTSLDIRDVILSELDGFVSVSYFTETIWDENDAVFDLARRSVDIMPLLFKIAGVKNVKVIELGSFTAQDKYGNESKDVLPSVAITITKADADKINWTGINNRNRAGIVALATDLYMNPSIRANLNNEDISEALYEQSDN